MFGVLRRVCGARGKTIWKAVAKWASCRGEERVQRMCILVVGCMPTSAGGAYYCLVIVDNAIDIDRPVGISDNNAATGTNGFRTFVPAAHAYGKPACPRTVNGHVFTNKGFDIQMADANIGRVKKSVDGPKRNGRVGRKIVVPRRGWQRSRMFISCLMAWSLCTRPGAWA